MRWCYAYCGQVSVSTVAAVDCTWCALTLTRQLQTLDLPPFSSFDMHMRPALAIDMLIRALVRGLNCCGGTTLCICIAPMSVGLTAMPTQYLTYHTSSKLDLVAQHVASTCHTSAQGVSSKFDPTVRRQLPVLRHQSRPGDYVTRRVHRHLLGVSRFALPSCPSFPTEL
jgi:hypothetical protein